MSSLELKHRMHVGSHDRWDHRGSLRLTTRGPPWKPKLFPKLICVSSLGIWASRSWERCVQEETGAKKPNSLEARTPHQCDDGFLCLFFFGGGGIPEHKPIPPQGSHWGGLPGIWHVDLTALACTCSYPLGSRDVELYICQLEFQPHPSGSRSCSSVLLKFWRSADPTETSGPFCLPLLIYIQLPWTNQSCWNK